jgi:hypothetical protein
MLLVHHPSTTVVTTTYHAPTPVDNHRALITVVAVLACVFAVVAVVLVVVQLFIYILAALAIAAVIGVCVFLWKRHSDKQQAAATGPAAATDTGQGKLPAADSGSAASTTQTAAKQGAISPPTPPLALPHA